MGSGKKKPKQRSMAQQFLEDDLNSGFSKRKYETLNDRKRRMGTKKAGIKIHKNKAREQKFRGKKEAAPKKKRSWLWGCGSEFLLTLL